MNSTCIKALRCYFCSGIQTVEEINFPENVFDLIRQHKLDNLLWICDSCKCSRNLNDLNKNSATFINKSSVACPEILDHMLCEKCNKFYDTIDCSTKWETGLVRCVSSPGGCSKKGSRSPSPPDKNRSARKYAHSILNTIKIPHDNVSKNKNIVNIVLDTLLNNMTINEEFKGMFNRLYYTGSSYNDLRITSATEFDINLVLKLSRYVTLTPEVFEDSHSFVKLKCESSTGVTDSSLNFFNKNSDKNYLNPHKVLSWLQRHIDLILDTNLEWPTDVHKVVNSSSGPARTIIIYTDFGYEISIDLVPVFEFEYTLLSATHFYDKMKEFVFDNNESKFFFTVPKACTDQENVTVIDSKICWRLDFPNAEKYILSKKECAKSVIKILKKFRDKSDWKGLASYYLKMVVMLEILKNSSKEYWMNGNVISRLLDCMKQLRVYLMDGVLPHFLTQCNLIHKLNESQRVDWSNRLKRVIGSWESDPRNIDAFLKDS